MAEDLTEYLHENGVRVRYMHSDIDTIERIEIIRDLRLGAFDVLVGINLLREGLDIPECALVAILDADKEGFLRSETSLVQTIGRAARNVDGKVILYADRDHRLDGPRHGRNPAAAAKNSWPGTRNTTSPRPPSSAASQDILGSVYEQDHVTRGHRPRRSRRSAIIFRLPSPIWRKRCGRRRPISISRRRRGCATRSSGCNAVELTVSDDPLARQSDVEAGGGGFRGERKYGAAANLPPSRAPQADRRRHGPA